MTDIVERLRERPYRMASESNTEMQSRRQAEREYAAHEIEVLRLEKAKQAARIEQLEAEVKKYAMDGLLATDGNLMLHEENQRLRAALRVAAHELELLYFFAISNGIAEAGVPPHVAARAALGEKA